MDMKMSIVPGEALLKTTIMDLIKLFLAVVNVVSLEIVQMSKILILECAILSDVYNIC